MTTIIKYGLKEDGELAVHQTVYDSSGNIKMISHSGLDDNGVWDSERIIEISAQQYNDIVKQKRLEFEKLKAKNKAS